MFNVVKLAALLRVAVPAVRLTTPDDPAPAKALITPPAKETVAVPRLTAPAPLVSASAFRTRSSDPPVEVTLALRLMLLSACNVSVVGVIPVCEMGALTVMLPASASTPVVVMVTLFPAFSAFWMVVLVMVEPVAVGVQIYGFATTERVPFASAVAVMVTLIGSSNQLPDLPFSAVASIRMPATSR